MVGLSSFIKRLWTLAIFVLPVACIEENTDYSSPPNNKVLSSITFRDFYTNALIATAKASPGPKPHSIEMNWSGSANPLPFHKLPKRTLITFDGKLITEVFTSFDDGRSFTDYFEYNQNKRLTKAKRVDVILGYEYVATFHYRTSGQVDSIGLEQTITNSNVVTKRTGFFKETPSGNYISIFPFNKTLPYSMDDAFAGSDNIRTAFASSNENNKWVHGIGADELRTKIRTPFGVNEIYEYDVYHVMNRSSKRYSDEVTGLYCQTGSLSSSYFPNCGLGYYILLSEFIPDGYLVNQVFFLVDYLSKFEKTEFLEYEITLDFTWNDQAL